MRVIVPPDEGSFSYAGMGYANPHVVTKIVNGRVTTGLCTTKRLGKLPAIMKVI
jgi:hypothetical protein